MAFILSLTEFDSRKDSQSTTFKRTPQILITLSFRDLCHSKLSDLCPLGHSDLIPIPQSQLRAMTL